MKSKNELHKAVQKMIGEMFQPEAAMYEKHGCQLNFRFKTSKKGNPYLLVSVQLANDSKSTAIRKRQIKIWVFSAKRILQDPARPNLHTPEIKKVEKYLKKDLKLLSKCSAEKYFKTRYAVIFCHLIILCRFYSVYEEYYNLDNSVFIIIVIILISLIFSIVRAYFWIKFDTSFWI